MFIGLYCCLLVRVQPLSLAWADLHHTDSLWALFQGPIVEFQLGYPIFYLGTSEIFPSTQGLFIINLINNLGLKLVNSINRGLNFPTDLKLSCHLQICDYRIDWDLEVNQPIAINYYPVCSFLNKSIAQFFWFFFILI